MFWRGNFTPWIIDLSEFVRQVKMLITYSVFFTNSHITFTICVLLLNKYFAYYNLIQTKDACIHSLAKNSTLHSIVRHFCFQSTPRNQLSGLLQADLQPRSTKRTHVVVPGGYRNGRRVCSVLALFCIACRESCGRSQLAVTCGQIY